MAEHLPSFERPPLIETVLGMQFVPLDGLTTAHLGLFWRNLGDTWTRVIEADPVGQIPVDNGALQAETILRGSLGRRLRFMDATGSRMVQVENGWLVHNWRRRHRDDPYPTFEKLLPEFENVLGAWLSFLAAQGFVDARPSLWEVSYVNLIERGTLWKTPQDWPDLLPALLGSRAGSQLGPLMSMEGSWQFPILNAPGGSLVASIGSIGGEAGRETLRLTLTARGRADDRASLELGLQDGHRAIVTTFAEFTSPAAHQYWKRTR